jgi:type IX secretion system PorP/SprF family membrane protein
MKKYFVLFVALITASSAFAQQDPIYAQYINNPFVLNPAYAGVTNNLNTSLSYRQQWAGYEGNPTTVNANGHISLRDNTMGAGLMFISDRIGATTTNEVYGSFAYRIKVDDDKTLSFGLQVGFINFKTENSKLIIHDPNDPVFTGETSNTKLSLGSGLILTNDKFFIGLSVPRMLKTKTTIKGKDFTEYAQHFYAVGSYIFFLSDRIRFRPSVLSRLVSGAPASFDINTAFILHENYVAGILTRNLSTYGIFLQAIVKQSFRFGYAFEMPTNKSVGSSFSTHEVTIGFRTNVMKFHTYSGAANF